MLRVVCCCFYFSFQFHTFHYVATQLIQLHHVVVIAALAFSSLFHSIIVIILVHNSLLYFSPSSSFFLSSFFFISFFHPSNFQTISPNFLLIINLFHFFSHSFNLLHFPPRSEEHTSELQSLAYLVCRLLLEKKKNILF